MTTDEDFVVITDEDFVVITDEDFVVIVKPGVAGWNIHINQPQKALPPFRLLRSAGDTLEFQMTTNERGVMNGAFWFEGCTPYVPLPSTPPPAAFRVWFRQRIKYLLKKKDKS